MSGTPHFSGCLIAQLMNACWAAATEGISPMLRESHGSAPSSMLMQFMRMTAATPLITPWQYADP